MRMQFRRHLTTILVAMVTAAVTAGGPALAAAVANAVNADKVDGKHAVGAGTSVAGRKGKLVATSGTTGKLPNNIIAKAPNADKLDGINSTGFLRAAAKAADANTLDGIDSGGFLRAGAQAADADKLDGLNSDAFERKFKRTIVVSPVGTEAQNGAALAAALASIPSTGPTQPVPRQSWLIHIEPGAYALSAPLQMRAWVDIEGSGIDTTILQCNCPGDTYTAGEGGAVRGASGAALRSLSVVNVTTAGDAAAYMIGGDNSARLTDVLLSASAPSGQVAAGLLSRGEARVTLTQASAGARSGSPNYAAAVYATGNSRVYMVDSQAQADYALGTFNTGRVRVANSMLEGAIAGTAGSSTCVGAYDPQFVALSTSCGP